MKSFRRFISIALPWVLLPAVYLLAGDVLKTEPRVFYGVVALSVLCVLQYLDNVSVVRDAWKMERSRDALQVKYTALEQDCHRLTDEVGDLQRKGSIRAVDLALANCDTIAIDNENHYSLIKLVARIDVAGNYTAHYERHGVNVSDQPIDHIKVITCADAFTPFSKLNIEAHDLKNPQNPLLKVDALVDEGRTKLFKIYFRTPVPSGERFAIGWTVTWPGVMNVEKDHDYIMLKNFRKGVDKVSYTLEFDWELMTFHFAEIRNEKPTLMNGSEAKQGNLYTYALEVSNPSGDAYFFSYGN